MQADVIVSPIVLVPIDVTIIGLDINTPAIRDSIQSGIETFLYDVRPFIAGADLRRNKNDILYSGKLQSVVTEGLVNGNYFTNLELFVDGNLSVFYEFTLGNIPYLRDLTINGTLV
jgi:hypothetical protein